MRVIMSKTYLIETKSTFILGYVVEMDDDADPRKVAEDLINGNLDEVVENYQYHSGETFDQCIPLKKEQIGNVFRAKNNYLAHLSNDEILQRFTIDARTK